MKSITGQDQSELLKYDLLDVVFSLLNDKSRKVVKQTVGLVVQLTRAEKTGPSVRHSLIKHNKMSLFEKMIKNGDYSFVYFGRTASGKTVQSYSYSYLDPHRSTAALMCETAMCVLQHRDQLQETAGFWTPGTAIGQLLRDNLAKNKVLEFGVGEVRHDLDFAPGF